MAMTEQITLGILGGGQLGRMSAEAAQKLGIKTIIYCPEDSTPASQIADQTIQGAYDDKAKLNSFAALCDVITYEFENIPLETLDYLEMTKPVYPKPNLLKTAQDRVLEKTYLNSIGIPTAHWAPITSKNDLHEALKSFKNNQLILKTARFGYDGKGQRFIRHNMTTGDINIAFDELKSSHLVAEEVIDFVCEVSVLIARNATGDIQTYGPCLNLHKNHILDQTLNPISIPKSIRDNAINQAKDLAQQIDLIGVLALEMFITRDGRIIANEIAPRPHNSGHYTLDACTGSQFENHVRAVCGLPLADAHQHTPALMINLIGDDVLDLDQYDQNPRAHIHLYGKDDVKPGRKMGHVTILNPTDDEKKAANEVLNAVALALK